MPPPFDDPFDSAEGSQSQENQGFPGTEQEPFLTLFLTEIQKKGQEVLQNAVFCPSILQKSPQNNKKDLQVCKSCGADTRIRTGDLILTKDALYLLSYISTLLHRATDIYYHIFRKKARGKMQIS